MRRGSWLSTAAVASAIAVLGGCGVSNSDEPSGAEARLIDQINAICRSANDQAEAVGTPNDPAGRLDAARKLADIRQRERDQIKDVPSPKGSYRDNFATFQVWLENLVSDEHFIALRLQEGNLADADKFTSDAANDRRQMSKAASRLRARECEAT